MFLAIFAVFSYAIKCSDLILSTTYFPVCPIVALRRAQADADKINQQTQRIYFRSFRRHIKLEFSLPVRRHIFKN